MSNENELQLVPIHQSVIRPNTLWGGDREIILMALVVAAACIFILQNTVSVIFGILLWQFALFSTRLMVKSDPKMRDIYMKHVKYQRIYKARSTPFKTN